MPILAAVIPAIIDLDEAQELEKENATRAIKDNHSKMPIDKNGELIFDIDEARDLHNNAVAMLSKAIGVDILTTLLILKWLTYQIKFNSFQRRFTKS